MEQYDVIVIGAGHNGLVAAAYLAKGGKRVLVVEARDRVGGAAVTEELFPGFQVSTCADGSGYLCDEIRRDLKLEPNGLEVIPAEAVVFAPQPGGKHLTLWRDSARSAEEIAKFSRKDAEAYPAFVELMGKVAGVVGGMARISPPDLPEVGRRDLRSLFTLAGPLRGLGRKNLSELLRVLPMPVADLLNEWFESPELTGAIAASGVRNITWGPREAGTAYTLLYDWALSDTGLFRSAGVVRGGMGALTRAIAESAKAAGVQIRTDSPVKRVVLDEGRAVGVELVGGEVLNARRVVSNADPRTTFTRLLDPQLQSARQVKHVRNIKYRGSGARIHLALSGLPQFSGLDESEAASRLSGPIQIAPSMDYLQRAYDCVKYGEFSPQPYLDILIPSLSDPNLAPAGQHLMSITAKYAPHSLRVGSWDDQRDAFTAAALDTLSEYAPGIRELILHQQTLVPPDLEAAFGLPEGNPNHGEMTLDQFFHMRPIPGHARYASAIEGLYLCGAGTHPGGGVTGIPGRNAARELLAGWS